MIAYATVQSMTKRFALIVHQLIESDLHSREWDQIEHALQAERMRSVPPAQRAPTRGTPARAWTCAGARAPDTCVHVGARAAGARKGEVERW